MTTASRHSVVCLLAFFPYHYLVGQTKLKIIHPTVKSDRNEARNLKRNCQLLLNFQGASDFPLGWLILGHDKSFAAIA